VHTKHRSQTAALAGFEPAAFLRRGIVRQLRADEDQQQPLRLCLLPGGGQQVGEFLDIHGSDLLADGQRDSSTRPRPAPSLQRHTLTSVRPQPKPPMTASFRPAWWLPSPHLRTLWSPFFRAAPRLVRQRERLWLADGDFLDLDWYGPHDPGTPLVLVLHGLTGSSSSLYVLGLQRQLAERGWASVALNWRGCSGEPNRLPRAYHSGASDDLAEVVAHLRAQRPLAALYAAGYSLGGNVLLKYLGESGADCPLQGAVAVSVPYRLDQCADRIALGFSRIYQRH